MDAGKLRLMDVTATAGMLVINMRHDHDLITAFMDPATMKLTATGVFVTPDFEVKDRRRHEWQWTAQEKEVERATKRLVQLYDAGAAFANSWLKKAAKGPQILAAVIKYAESIQLDEATKPGVPSAVTALAIGVADACIAAYPERADLDIMQRALIALAKARFGSDATEAALREAGSLLASHTAGKLSQEQVDTIFSEDEVLSPAPMP